MYTRQTVSRQRFLIDRKSLNINVQSVSSSADKHYLSFVVILTCAWLIKGLATK